MKQRGRRSGASMGVVTGIKDARPRSPEELLKPDQKKLWREIVEDYPSGWFDAASRPLLAEYCRLHSSVNRLAKAIDDFQDEWLQTDDGVKRYKDLTGILDKQHSRMAQLATKMRISQQSRYRGENADTAKRKVTKSKLWERG